MDKKTKRKLQNTIDELKNLRYVPSIARGRLSTHECQEFSRGYAWGMQQAIEDILEVLGDSQLLDDWYRTVKEVRK